MSLRTAIRTSQRLQALVGYGKLKSLLTEELWYIFWGGIVGTVIAFHATGGGENRVSGFSDEIQLSLQLPGGKYVVHARLEFNNLDGDSQKASCGIRIRSSLVFIDRLDFVLPGLSDADELTFSLQGVCNLPEQGDTIDLTAGTYNGVSDLTSLSAISVDVT